MAHQQSELQAALAKKRKAEEALEALRESTAVANAAAKRLEAALLVHSQTICTHARASSEAQQQQQQEQLPSATAVMAKVAAPASASSDVRGRVPSTKEPHFLVASTVSAATGRHGRLVCELCRLDDKSEAAAAASRKANTPSTSGGNLTAAATTPTEQRSARVTLCCPTCRMGFHPECFVAYHFTESLRECNPEVFGRVTKLKANRSLQSKISTSAAIPTNYFQTLVLPSMKKKPPTATANNTNQAKKDPDEEKCAE